MSEKLESETPVAAATICSGFPARDGYYWWRPYDIHPWEIIHLRRIGKTRRADWMVSNYDMTEPLWIERHKGSEMEWVGPFFPPNAGGMAAGADVPPMPSERKA